jgi:hypothetical protein
LKTTKALNNSSGLLRYDKNSHKQQQYYTEADHSIKNYIHKS